MEKDPLNRPQETGMPPASDSLNKTAVNQQASVIGKQVLNSQVRGKEKMGAMFQHKPEWFLEFLRQTNQKRVLVANISDTIMQQYPALRDTLRTGKADISILGGGTAEPELAILKYLAPSVSRLHYEDPSTEMEELFRKNLTTSAFASGEVDASQQKLEDADYQIPPSDLIVASHMFYYVSSWRDPANTENPLRKMHSALKGGGVGVIASQSRKSDNYAFRSRFLPKIHGPDVSELQTEDIRNALEQLAIPHRSEIVGCKTFVDEMFDMDGHFHPNEQGAKLLSFLLRYDWKALDDDLRNEVAMYMTTSVHNENGRRFMVFRDLFLWMTK